MSQSIFIAHASPSSAAEEQAFNEWYTSTHIPEVRTAIPEITAVSRHRAWNPDPEAFVRYVAIYTVQGLSAAEVAAKLGAAAPSFSSGPMADSGEHAATLIFADSTQTE